MSKQPRKPASDPIRFAARILEAATGSSTPAAKPKPAVKRTPKPRKAG